VAKFAAEMAKESRKLNKKWLWIHTDILLGL
jgi:hypothetical protein